MLPNCLLGRVHSMCKSQGGEEISMFKDAQGDQRS